ncbi:MAG: PEP-CTERM/exosortase system-associated acyltransferase [Candidatus Omnitrophota bacterium]
MGEQFSFLCVDPSDQSMMEQIYRLRLRVYGEECGFIDPKDYPEGMERDGYDDQAAHFVALGEPGDVIGYLRMILPGKLQLPFEEHFPELQIDPDIRTAGAYSEISRLVISKRLRRRRHDGIYYEPEFQDRVVKAEDGQEFMRRAKPMAFGLYREMYQESKRRGLKEWYSIMEKTLWILLKVHGFNFKCVGEEVDIFGPVRPYRGNIAGIEEEIRTKHPDFWAYFTGDSSWGVQTSRVF